MKREKLRRLYRLDPEYYALTVLGVKWWEKQIEVAQALLDHKRVFVKASHSVGKSFLAGGLVNWFFDCFSPGICLTTAPNSQQVKDILWKEVRVQRPKHARGALQPKAPRMESSPEHFAVGFTARDDSGFQGRHEEFVLIVFDEGTGVAAPFWDAAEGMMTGPHCYWLVILNPTDTSSRAYEECQDTEKWKVIEISAMEHPNIAADLENRPAPFPKAVRLEWILGRLKQWCTKLPGNDPHNRRVGDFEFPPQSGDWWRPGPLFESRVLGLWPTQGSTSVWSEAMWNAATKFQHPLDVFGKTEIGCDKARFGDDFTSFVVRRGDCVLHHETHNGWDNKQIAGRLKQLCRQFAREGEKPHTIICRVDDVQGGVIDLADGFNFVCVNSASVATDENRFPNKRSELWFTTAERAYEGRLDLTRLPEENRRLLQKQAMAPTWKVDSQGRQEVEKKDLTKKRIGRSPDDMDAFNLAFDSTGADWGDILLGMQTAQLEVQNEVSRPPASKAKRAKRSEEKTRTTRTKTAMVLRLRMLVTPSMCNGSPRAGHWS